MAASEQFQLKYIQASDARVHYIETGSPSLPTLLLLHGFPTCALQFRTLIPLLSPHYHILAPTLPGFGNTVPSPTYTYTFASLARTISSFLSALHVTSYAAYIFDYGAPVLFRIALSPPPNTHLRAIISQNGNVYAEGLGATFWAPIRALWESENSEAAREVIKERILTPETTEYQYRAGVPDSKQGMIDPASYRLDYLENLAPASERQDAQVDLLFDYRTNVALYPQWQAWLRESRVPLLAVWGRGDPAFVPAGAEAFGRDLPGARVRLLDTGHFALATDVEVVAEEIREFLAGLEF